MVSLNSCSYTKCDAVRSFVNSLPASAAGGSCAGGARAAADGVGLPTSALAESSEGGEGSLRLIALTVRTGDRIIGLADSPQDLEFTLAIGAIVFVERHMSHLFIFILKHFAKIVKYRFHPYSNTVHNCVLFGRHEIWKNVLPAI